MAKLLQPGAAVLFSAFVVGAMAADNPGAQITRPAGYKPMAGDAALGEKLFNNTKEIPMNFIKTATVLALSALASIAMAGDIKPFSQAAFDKLAQEGKPVVLDISATWCPTCKEQKPIVESLMKQPAYKDVTLMNIDFDSSKPTLKKFKVAMQSTLIAFKGGKETARSVGDTSPEGIEALIKKAAN